MQIDVDYTLEQFKEANTFLLLNTTLSRKLNYYAAKFGYPVLVIVFSAAAFLIWFTDRRLSSGVVQLLLIASLMAFARYRFGSAVRRAYERQHRYLQSVLMLNEGGIESTRRDGSASTRLLWSAVEKWAERGDAIFLIVGHSSYLRVPCQHMSLEERKQVRDWLAGIPKLK